MKKVFILMLFAMSMLYFSQAMALPHIDQTVICNEEDKSGDGKDDGKKDGEENPEEDCE